MGQYHTLEVRLTIPHRNGPTELIKTRMVPFVPRSGITLQVENEEEEVLNIDCTEVTYVANSGRFVVDLEDSSVVDAWLEGEDANKVLADLVTWYKSMGFN